MFYYQVVPASNRYGGSSFLTYCHKQALAPGQVVSLAIRQSIIAGIVLGQTEKPSFPTKELLDVFENIVLSAPYINLLTKMNVYYPGYPGSTAQLFAPSHILSAKTSIDSPLNKNIKIVGYKLPELTTEQNCAYKKIVDGKNPSTYLLHGETGSGKTRLYMELTLDCIASGKSVLILTPEISLTTPLAKRFREIFSDKVHINHSGLTQKQRSKIWMDSILAKNPIVVIGPRSSLFIPIKNLGLIVVDEFHESAYKQESQPYYSAIRLASMLSKESRAKLVLGSATPNISDYFLAVHKKISILKMKNQAITGEPIKQTLKIINLSDRLEKSPYPLLSNSLIKMIGEQIDDKKQAMLFINKRGSARSILCQDCGWRETCPRCDLPLIYHQDQHTVRCHTCGYCKKPPSVCPDCGSSQIIFKGPGTKSIAEQLAKIFPKANIKRFDKDNKKSERLENNYEMVLGDQVDIIVGTQIIIKGHDMPRLGLIAMLQAESSLNFPDFSSEEKSYQMIKQLSGRVGRGHVPGTVVLQAFNPDNPTIDMATEQPWEVFYKYQIKQREKLNFPPFCYALKIESSRKSQVSAESSLVTLVAKIKKLNHNLEILGPSPCFIEKKADKYSWQIIIKSKNRSILTKLLVDLPSNFKAEIDPLHFL